MAHDFLGNPLSDDDVRNFLRQIESPEHGDGDLLVRLAETMQALETWRLDHNPNTQVSTALLELGGNADEGRISVPFDESMAEVSAYVGSVRFYALLRLIAAGNPDLLNQITAVSENLSVDESVRKLLASRMMLLLQSDFLSAVFSVENTLLMGSVLEEMAYEA